MRAGRTARIFWLAIIFSCFANAADPFIASYPVQSMGDMMPRWDQGNRRVLSYQSQTASEQVGVQITSIDPSEPTVKINVLKDFPGASQAILVGIAPGPGRSIFVAGRLQYSKPEGGTALKEVILTYDASGKLIKVWDVAPYEPETIASDESGNVYSFGVRFDVFNRKGTAIDYGTLVEYSPDGKVVKEMLAASLFPRDVDPAEFTSETGSRVVSVTNDRIYVYASKTSEVFVLDRSGNLMRRYSILNITRDLAARNHYAVRELIEVAFDREGNLYFDMGLGEPTAKGLPNAVRIGAKLYSTSLESSQWPSPWEMVGKKITMDRRMIGINSDGSVVSLVRNRGRFSVEITAH